MSQYPYKHAMQNTYLDEHGTLRFVENEIVSYLLRWSSDNGCSLNDLAIMNFSDDDWRQFQQLHGYSVGGFTDMSFVHENTDGYYDYLQNQLPQYFDDDDDEESGTDEESVSEMTEEDFNPNFSSAIMPLLNIVKDQVAKSKEQSDTLSKLADQVIEENARLRTENVSKSEIINTLQSQINTLQSQVDQACDVGEKLVDKSKTIQIQFEEIKEQRDKLQEWQNNMLESRHTFHECNGKIRGFSTLCCSMARPDDHNPEDDFDAVQKIQELMEENASLKAQLEQK